MSPGTQILEGEVLPPKVSTSLFAEPSEKEHAQSRNNRGVMTPLKVIIPTAACGNRAEWRGEKGEGKGERGDRKGEKERIRIKMRRAMSGR